jgi:hypothetical protein
VKFFFEEFALGLLVDARKKNVQPKKGLEVQELGVWDYQRIGP